MNPHVTTCHYTPLTRRCYVMSQHVVAKWVATPTGDWTLLVVNTALAWGAVCFVHVRHVGHRGLLLVVA